VAIFDPSLSHGPRLGKPQKPEEFVNSHQAAESSKGLLHLAF
jgi:hypothetical protein